MAAASESVKETGMLDSPSALSISAADDVLLKSSLTSWQSMVGPMQMLTFLPSHQNSFSGEEVGAVTR